MSYANQKRAAVAVAALSALIGFIQLGNAELLGLTPRALAWLGITASFLGFLAGALPSWRSETSDPRFLAHRVSELDTQDQAIVHREVQKQAGNELPPSVAATADELGEAFARHYLKLRQEQSLARRDTLRMQHQPEGETDGRQADRAHGRGAEL